mmetsp:Transcript_14139/g.14768  ORF Transcript_14139/g.14768 Transcript_14139/m.14768 type:complete len:207 (-) Transcript_14139:1180-1800(-)
MYVFDFVLLHLYLINILIYILFYLNQYLQLLQVTKHILFHIIPIQNHHVLMILIKMHPFLMNRLFVFVVMHILVSLTLEHFHLKNHSNFHHHHQHYQHYQHQHYLLIHIFLIYSLMLNMNDVHPLYEYDEFLLFLHNELILRLLTMYQQLLFPLNHQTLNKKNSIFVFLNSSKIMYNEDIDVLYDYYQVRKYFHVLNSLHQVHQVD